MPESQADAMGNTTKYEYNTLVRNRLQHFDAWASTFGETVSAIDAASQL
ncbi:MAG: hypothetical protein NC489_33310 [Ruminococcus flavefaciens]|nr:hypothetical protein [Ruminococcus flavefaciens]